MRSAARGQRRREQVEAGRASRVRRGYFTQSPQGAEATPLTNTRPTAGLGTLALGELCVKSSLRSHLPLFPILSFLTLPVSSLSTRIAHARTRRPRLRPADAARRSLHHESDTAR